MRGQRALVSLLVVAVCACSASSPGSTDAAAPQGLTADATDGRGGPETTVPSASDAHTGGLSESFDRCMSTAGGITPEIQSCLDAEVERQEKRLSTAYDQLLSTLDNQRRAILASEQEAWVTRRDAECAYLADEGGQAEQLESDGCYLDEVAARAAELERRLAGGDG